jgi:hypothetical protein
MDVATMAESTGLSTSEIGRIADLQDDAGDLLAVLETKNADTFGGMWVDHAPFLVSVAVTDDGDWIDAITPSPLKGLVRVTRVKHTLGSLVSEVGPLSAVGIEVTCPHTRRRSADGLRKSQRRWQWH